MSLTPVVCASLGSHAELEKFESHRATRSAGASVMDCACTRERGAHLRRVIVPQVNALWVACQQKAFSACRFFSALLEHVRASYQDFTDAFHGVDVLAQAASPLRR